MIYLVAQPECAYCKDKNEVIERWFPPKGHWFKFAIEEFVDGATLEEMRAKLLLADQPVYLTAEELDKYQKYNRKS